MRIQGIYHWGVFGTQNKTRSRRWRRFAKKGPFLSSRWLFFWLIKPPSLTSSLKRHLDAALRHSRGHPVVECSGFRDCEKFFAAAPLASGPNFQKAKNFTLHLLQPRFHLIMPEKVRFWRRDAMRRRRRTRAYFSSAAYLRTFEM